MNRFFDGFKCFSSNWNTNPLATGVEGNENDDVTFATDFIDNTFAFDSLGRPISCGPCNISIIGEETLKIKIEKEGYVHAL